jgi:hypothetical protein
MPSLLAPVLMKKPVPHPRPAMLQFPAAGKKSPEMSALPSTIRVMGLSAVATAIAALMRGASSVAVPPVNLLRPFLRSQFNAQPISDARMYVIPVTGVGAGAAPKHGIENPAELQLIRLHPNAAPAAKTPVFKKARLSIRGRTAVQVSARLGRFNARHSRICLGRAMRKEFPATH